MKEIRYSVANHLFTVAMPKKHILWQYMEAYTPFEVDETEHDKPMFRLELKDQHEFAADTGEYKVYKGDMVNLTVSQTDNTTLIGFRTAPSSASSNLIIRGKRHAYFIPGKSTSDNLFNLNNALMLLYTLTASSYGTLLFHASVVEKDGKGYMFLGRSGRGKSTHSRLWIEYVKDSKLLNDDNPVVRIMHGKPVVFGSPWSGKTPCYRNSGVELGGIVRIVPAPENRISILNIVKSYACILSSCSCVRWDIDHTREVHQAAEQLITNTACYDLECLPDAEAALLCHKRILLAPGTNRESTHFISIQKCHDEQ